MLSTFSKLLPTNVSITTPDFLKLNAPTPSRHEAQQSAHSQPMKREADSQTSTTTDGAAELEVSPSKNKDRPSKIKKRRDTATATETFIIVRPPPSMSNHPLNLQVQLVASSGRERILTRSANSSRETFNDVGEQPASQGDGLKRTSSLRSNRSDTESTYSASSLASGASGSGSSSGRRMIPLYNLHAHNVMTNVITDAGTDAKIAKFFKRGLEIMGLAMLEPVEVYGKYNWNDSFDTLEPHGVHSTSGSGFGNQVSRTISQISSISMPRGVDGHATTETYHDLPTVVEVPSSPTTPKPVEKESSSKKLFANIFKKKKDPPAPLALNPTPESTPTSAKRKSATPSFMISSPKFGSASTPTTASILTSPTGNLLIPSSSSGGPNSASGPGEGVILQPQVLGLQAVLCSPTGTVPTKGRPSTYAWVVRKWIKGSDEGLIGAMVDSLGTALTGSGWGNQPAGSGGMGGADVEVRFEWRRGSKSKSSGSAEGGERRKRNATGSTIGAEDKGSRRHSIAFDVPSSSGNSRVPSESGTHASNGVGVPLPGGGAASKRLSLQVATGANKRGTIPAEVNGDSLQIRAGSPNPPASIQTSTTDENGPRNGGAVPEDEDSDSDIEDSERPWNCYLHIRGSARFAHAHSTSGSRTASRRGSRDELGHPDEDGHPREKMLDIKLRVACMAPAPHHPKVIAQIKTPYPLPDVVFDPAGSGVETSSVHELPSMAPAALLRPRDADGSKSELDVNRAGTITGLVLSAEEIKDVVSCTGLWLVVREGYGGLARKRKGDGWRLRG